MWNFSHIGILLLGIAIAVDALAIDHERAIRKRAAEQVESSATKSTKHQTSSTQSIQAEKKAPAAAAPPSSMSTQKESQASSAAAPPSSLNTRAESQEPLAAAPPSSLNTRAESQAPAAAAQPSTQNTQPKNKVPPGAAPPSAVETSPPAAASSAVQKAASAPAASVVENEVAEETNQSAQISSPSESNDVNTTAIPTTTTEKALPDIDLISARMIFLMFDSDLDNRFSKTEFGSYYKMNGTSLDESFNEADKNKNGFIDLEEMAF